MRQHEGKPCDQRPGCHSLQEDLGATGIMDLPTLVQALEVGEAMEGPLASGRTRGTCEGALKERTWDVVASLEKVAQLLTNGEEVEYQRSSSCVVAAAMNMRSPANVLCMVNISSPMSSLLTLTTPVNLPTPVSAPVNIAHPVNITSPMNLPTPITLVS
ncbi:hypothetical protein E2320_000214 [Naja naja]|nr:hypothetical protein E2320_000214 [Naja naja]